MLKRVLVANRGEIAVRIIRALREMGIESIAVYSDVDKNALHTSLADYAFALKGNRAADTYMNIAKILQVAKIAGADGIHPGYGFLSEKPDFAEAVEKEGIKFIGPKSDIIRLMGNKIEARKLMVSIGVPVVRGGNSPVSGFDEALETATAIGYPVLIKASAGGGGMGMKTAYNDDELKENLEAVQKAALSLFRDDSVFIEKYIERPRHIEVQVLGDVYGHYIHLGERECSIQRRHQKVVEEAPSPALTPELREAIGQTAVRIARSVGYNSVGTVEFIYDDGSFYFLEMNTRIQVEHTVTEMITGIDIVKAQVEIADGNPLQLKQEDVRFNGHAIECRICSEDYANSFIPSPGVIQEYIQPGGLGVRLDSGVTAGYEVSSYYDSMLAKLIVWGNDRKEARDRMTRALSEFVIAGPKTTIPLLWAIMNTDDYNNKNINTKFIEEHADLFEIARHFAENTLKKRRILILDEE